MNEINIKLTPREKARLARGSPVDPEVYQLYLRGRYHWNKRTAEGLRKGLEYFQLALEKDPAFPLAYAGVADSYNLLGNYSLLVPKEAFPRAKAAAMKALEMDDTLVEAHTSLAYAKHHYDWDWPGAEKEFKRAIELNPGYATAHQWYGEFPTTIGRYDEGLAEIRRARELDPLSLVINTNVGRLSYHARRYDQAIEELRNTLDLDPNYYWALIYLGLAYGQKGLYAEAITEFQKAEALAGERPGVGQAYVYAVSGRRDDARKILDYWIQRSNEEIVDPFFIAGIHAGLGEKDQAFTWLEKAYAERSFSLVFLKVHPWVDNLRSDPRLDDLVGRVGLP